MDPTTLALVLFGINVVAQALPDPEPKDSKWYKFGYKLAHLVALNSGVVRKRF